MLKEKWQFWYIMISQIAIFFFSYSSFLYVVCFEEQYYEDAFMQKTNNKAQEKQSRIHCLIAVLSIILDNLKNG